MTQDYWHVRVNPAEKQGSRRSAEKVGLAETAWLRMVVRRAIADELGEAEAARLFNGMGGGANGKGD